MIPPVGRNAIRTERRTATSKAVDETEDVVEEATRDALDVNCAACVGRVIKDGRIAGNADSAAFVRCKFDVRKDILRMLTSASGSVTCL